MCEVPLILVRGGLKTQYRTTNVLKLSMYLALNCTHRRWFRGGCDVTEVDAVRGDDKQNNLVAPQLFESEAWGAGRSGCSGEWERRVSLKGPPGTGAAVAYIRRYILYGMQCLLYTIKARL